jgi:effector-binding domain-containing protein
MESMPYSVEIVDMQPTILACVSERVAWGDLPKAIPRLLGEVGEFFKTAPVRPAGQNVVVYHDPGAEGARLEAGVQVSGEFPRGSRVVCARTPAGRAAHAIHIGPYHELGKCHDAVMEFCKGRGFGPGVHWEVYGDWNEDPDVLRTDVYRLIA